MPERPGRTAAQARDVYSDYDPMGLPLKVRFDDLGGERAAGRGAADPEAARA